MTHGPAAVHELVEESVLSYPVSVRRLEREHALANVTIDERGNSVMLAELLGAVEADSFEDQADLESTLEPVFADLRRRRNPGLVERAKRFFRG